MTMSVILMMYISAVNYCDSVRYSHSIFEPLYVKEGRR
jgi:hypothetical protein